MSFYERTEEENYQIAKDFVISTQIASVSSLQRRLRVGYYIAAKLMDRLESEGVVGPYFSGKPREVFIKETKE